MEQLGDAAGDNESYSSNDHVETGETRASESTQCTSKGKRLTSEVWKDMLRDEANGKATCKHCKRVFSGKHQSDTSHLKRHIEKCPAKKYLDMKNFVITGSGSPSIVESNASNPSNAMTLNMPTAGLDAIREAIAVMFVSCAQSFSLVEAPGFKYFMSVVVPHFHQISRVTLQKDTLSQYNAHRLVVAKELQDAPGRICFTSDNWRSERTTDEFMCITAHWIDKKWKLQKRIVKFAALMPQLDGSSLADEVLLCLGEWKISDKVFSFTLDNASYNDTMIASLRGHIMKKHSLVLDGEFFHLRCSCHIINLVVHAGLKVIDDVVLKIRRIVTHLRHSMPKNKKFYEAAATSYGLNTSMKLRLDTPTRWNSTYTMLDRFLYFRDAIDNFVGKDGDLKIHRLTDVEWEKVAHLQKFLKVFYDVTNELSASKTPTSNLYFHGVWKIHKLLTKQARCSSILSNMVNEMSTKFEKYWDEYNLLLSCAAVMDPQIKLVGVGFLYEKLYGEVYATEMMKKIKGTLVELLEEYRVIYGNSGHGSVNKEAGASSRSVQFTGFSGLDSDSDGESFDQFLSKKLKTDFNSELDLYLTEKPIARKEGFDILHHWKHSASRFSVLSALARDLLSVPVSTVPSESAFSLGKKIITSSRSSLSSSTVEALACYEDWLRAKGLEPGSASIFKIGDAPRIVDEED